MSGMAKTTGDSILGVIRKESWILDHFEIFVNIALNGALSNQCAWQRSALSECFSGYMLKFFVFSIETHQKTILQYRLSSHLKI